VARDLLPTIDWVAPSQAFDRSSLRHPVLIVGTTLGDTTLLAVRRAARRSATLRDGKAAKASRVSRNMPQCRHSTTNPPYWGGVVFLALARQTGQSIESILGSLVHRKPHQHPCQQETASEMRLKSTRANLVCAPKFEGHTADRIDDHPSVLLSGAFDDPHGLLAAFEERRMEGCHRCASSVSPAEPPADGIVRLAIRPPFHLAGFNGLGNHRQLAPLRHFVPTGCRRLRRRLTFPGIDT